MTNTDGLYSNSAQPPRAALSRLRFTPAGIAALALVSFTSLNSGTAAADPVYKSVDSRGEVSYGDKPAARATSFEEIAIEPGPSIERVLEQKEITERIRMAADELEAERLNKEEQLAEQRKASELEAQFQAELEAEVQQAEAATEAQRLAQEKAREQGRGSRPQQRPKGPQTNSDRAINMRPNAPLLNLPGPSE